MAVNKIGLAGLTDSSSDQSGGFLSGASALIGQLGQLVSPGPGFDTVNRLGEAASTESGELDITKNISTWLCQESQCQSAPSSSGYHSLSVEHKILYLDSS